MGTSDRLSCRLHNWRKDVSHIKGTVLPILFVQAHYTWPSLILNGAATPDWQYVRMTDNHYSNGPVTDVSSSSMKCYESNTASSTQTATVAAGATIGFKAGQSVYHPGYLAIYMSAANPANAESAGSGKTWFKVFEAPPVYVKGNPQLTFPTHDYTQVTFTIPKSIPTGQYLVRVEQIALHTASSFGGAQLYISCAQINVTGGGSGSPGPLVSIPGVYTGNEPGILINIYNLPSNYPGYTSPGPTVWKG